MYKKKMGIQRKKNKTELRCKRIKSINLKYIKKISIGYRTKSYQESYKIFFSNYFSYLLFLDFVSQILLINFLI